MAQFTTIDHEVRRKFNLTLNEYAICDSVYHLSRNRACNMTKENLGNFIGISKQSVHTILNTLETKGLISRPHRQHITTSDLWNDEISNQYRDSKESLPESKESLPSEVKKVDSKSKESLPNIYNNDIYNNNIINIKDVKKTNVETEIYKRIIDGFYQYHNKQYKFDGKEYGMAKKLAKTLIQYDNWEEILGNKIRALEKKVKENPKFWTFTIPKLEWGWNELNDMKQNSVDQTDKILNHLKDKGITCKRMSS